MEDIYVGWIKLHIEWYTYWFHFSKIVPLPMFSFKHDRNIANVYTYMYEKTIV